MPADTQARVARHRWSGTVGIGIRLRKLWRRRVGMGVSIALALFAGLWSVQRISLFPPGLIPRSLEMATASTHVLVDTPTSAMIDLRQDTYSIEGLTSRAVVLGNVIASSQMQAKIARRAHVPVELLRIQAPLTSQEPAPPVDSENARHASDILKSTDQFRIDLKANPTVPMLDVYAQTPTAESATALANAAVDELKVYLAALVARQHTPPKDQIRPVQLGRATGVVINHGVRWQAAFLAFLLTLGISCATVAFLARVRAGWLQQALSERTAQS
jgi:hypothetical protein